MKNTVNLKSLYLLSFRLENWSLKSRDSRVCAKRLILHIAKFETCFDDYVTIHTSCSRRARCLYEASSHKQISSTWTATYHWTGSRDVGITTQSTYPREHKCSWRGSPNRTSRNELAITPKKWRKCLRCVGPNPEWKSRVSRHWREHFWHVDQ